MGIGHDLGLQLRGWIEDGLDLRASPALTNRLMDALGADQQGLRAPLRDLAVQPLTLRALRLQGAEQQAALQALHQLLGETYSPRVLKELQEFLEAATGLPAAGPAATTTPAAPSPATIGLPAAGPAATPPAPSSPAVALPRATPRPMPRRRSSLSRRSTGWEGELQAIAPGLLAGGIGSFVLAWLSQELDRWTFERIGWSTGVALAVVLVGLQLLTLFPPLRPLRRRWLIDQPSSGDPHRIWSWVSAPWMHGFFGDALLNGLMLMILLGPTPLAAGKLVMRYTLTTLACQGAAVLVARQRGVMRRWGGASGAIAALVALAATLSLLKAHELAFPLGPLAIPAWVLFVVYAALQLSWELPRPGPEDTSLPADRLWSSPWWWGTLGGASWALITRATDLISPLLKGAS